MISRPHGGGASSLSGKELAIQNRDGYGAERGDCGKSVTRPLSLENHDRCAVVLERTLEPLNRHDV